MRRELIYTLAGAIALAALSAPVLAEPASTLLRGEAPDAPRAIGKLDVSAVPGWWASGTPLELADGVLAVFALCLLVASLVALSASAGRRAEDGGVLGSARIKTGAEVLRGSETWDGRSDPSARGFVYGYSRGRYLLEPERFALIDGATGSGKSRYMLIPTIDALTYGGASNGSEPHTVIVTDVKSELVELTGDELERRGYRILLLDAQHPLRGHRFNPLGLVLEYARKGLVQEAEQAADTIASLLVPDEGAGSSHWVESARALLSALVLLVALSPDCPDDARHLATVNEVLCRGTEGTGAEPAEPLKELFRSLPERDPTRLRASQLLSSGGNELRSVISTLKARMRIYGSAPVAWMTSTSDIDPYRILGERTAVFLHVLDAGSPYNALVALFVEQLWSAAQAAADAGGGSLPRPVTVVGDEWGNIPRVSALPSILSLGRSLGFFWVGAVQNISQLNAYGERDGREKILANCSVKVALKLGEAQDRAYFTELVGKTTRHTRGTSTSRGASGGSGSTSYSEHADDLVHPWEWTEMSPDRDGAIVVKMAMNGVPASHAGTFRSPLVDCTETPTRGHFDLGTREHERKRRRAYQRRLEEREEARRNEAVPIWCPEWTEEGGGEGPDEWDGLALD